MGFLLESWWNLFFVAWFALLVYLVDLGLNKLKYFDKRKILYVKPDFKSIINDLKNGTNIDEGFDKIYHKFPNARFVGYYFGLEPSFLIKDPIIVDMVTKINFNSFHDRYNFGPDEEVDPLLTNLNNLTEHKWKELRSKLNPFFTGNKMQLMFPLMQACANSFAQQLRKSNPNPEQDVDAKQLFSSCVFATLASCGFGIEPERIKDSECEFKRMINQSMTVSPMNKLIIFLKQNFPIFSSLIKSTPKNVDDYFISLAKKEMKNRDDERSQRQDFVQHLVQIKDKGNTLGNKSVKTEDDLQQPSSHYLDLNDGVLSSQMLMFFESGYEPTCQLLSIVCYYLSKNIQIQERIRRQLRESKKNHRTLNYQALDSITLLDYCILESLRMFPPVGHLKRVCTQDLVISKGKVVEQGFNIVIPVMSLQNDPKYWSKPNVFDPERFKRDEIVPGTYLPFGQGPRACIGQRFAMLQTKIILAKLLENFILNPSQLTSEPLKRGKWIDSNVSGGVWIRLHAIDLSTI